MQLSDVSQVTNMTLFDRASTHDRAWVWKPLNKARAPAMPRAFRARSADAWALFPLLR